MQELQGGDPQRIGPYRLEPIIKELSWRAEIPDPADLDGGRADWAVRLPGEPARPLPAPEASLPTLTAARPGKAPSPLSPQPQAGSSPGDAPRRRRRPAMMALMLVGVLAVASAGTAVGISLAGSSRQVTTSLAVRRPPRRPIDRGP